MTVKLNWRETKYRIEHMNGIQHATLNPMQNGSCTMHLIPPKFGVKKSEANGIKNNPSVMILNGQYIIPLDVSYAILMNELLIQLNKFAGGTITQINLEKVIRDTVNVVHKIYFKSNKEILVDDLIQMVNMFCAIAKGEQIGGTAGFTIGEYAPFMRAPHRMDLMVSAMTKNGHWHCNQKCLHCYAAGQPEAEVEELSTKQWKQIIDKLYEACVAQVTFTGGEPTMRNDLVELIAHSKQMVTRLNTNGINLTPELCEKLFEASLDSVQITFYSYDPLVHNQLVGVPMYDKTVAGIRNAISAGLSVSINTPLCTVNRDYIKTLQFLRSLGVQYVTCSGLIITGNATLDASKSTQLSNEELYQILKEAVDYCNENDMDLAFTSPGWISEDEIRGLKLNVPSCGACLSNMAIAPDGGVVPCQSWLSDNPLGNMLTNTWDEIWNSEACTALRTETAKCNYFCPLRDKDKANNC